MIALRVAFLSGILFLLSMAQGAELENQLLDHPAPYLALHGDDPVAWQTWGEKAVQTAKTQNRILYLSIGYFACHWCHVMQQESYKNEEIASFLNENFIPIKVDRELEPALDRRLMDFAQQILGRGGWPLNVFVTPSGHPIYAVLYAPPAQFLETLKRLQQVWETDPERVSNLVSKESITQFPATNSNLNRQVFSAIIQDAVKGVMARADLQHGGFGQQQKFPSTPQLKYLLKRIALNPDPEVREFLERTLNAMATRGMHDHLAGGFFRYTTDSNWAIPHFEKMLYDNANLAEIYILAGKILDKPEYHAIARQTLDFMVDNMWDSDGALVSSFSAVDDNNIEGGSYLWTPAQIRNILNAEQAHLILALWELDRESEFPAGNHARFFISLEHYASTNGIDFKTARDLYEQSRLLLLKSRQQRALPVDDKLLAGWNGLALSTYVEAAKRYADGSYADIARDIRDFLVEQVWDGKDLHRSLARGELMGQASLEDFAYVSRGLLDWAIYNQSQDDVEIVLELVNQGWQRFYRFNGWYQGDGTLLAPASGEELIADAANQSPSAVLISVSLRLAEYLKSQKIEEVLADDLQTRSLGALNRSEVLLTRAPFWFVSQLDVLSRAMVMQSKLN